MGTKNINGDLNVTGTITQNGTAIGGGGGTKLYIHDTITGYGIGMQIICARKESLVGFYGDRQQDVIPGLGIVSVTSGSNVENNEIYFPYASYKYISSLAASKYVLCVKRFTLRNTPEILIADYNSVGLFTSDTVTEL